MAKLLEHHPEIDPGYYSHAFELPCFAESLAAYGSVQEHPDGRLTLTLQEKDKDGEWVTITLLASQTERLRRLLNRAYRERQR
jgi:hypothetical protein